MVEPAMMSVVVCGYVMVVMMVMHGEASLS